MPRKNQAGISSAFKHVQQQARGLLGQLHRQIRTKEGELRLLKAEEASLSSLLDRSGSGRQATRLAEGGAIQGGSNGRINWRAVLQQLPKQFRASDVRRVRGLKSKRPSEIFAAITRWIDAGLAKRRSRGVYEKM